MIRPPRSLQGRLLALVLGVVGAVWLAAATMTWFDVRNELDELLDSHLAQAAALLVAQQAGEAEGEGESDRDDRKLDAPSLHRYAPKVAFQVFHEGQLALRSANAPALPMVRSDERVPAGFSSVQIDGIAWRVFAARGAEQDIQVFVGEQMASRDSILWAILRSTLSPVLVALPLLALAVWWAVRQGVAPLRNLGRTLAARQPQALAPIVIDHAPAEMQPMLDALNDLFARIATLMESERRFTADAAHELRTPIAAIRTQAQVALGEADAGQRRHALEATLEGCDRATRLVEQLLTLARLESGASTASQRLEMGPLLRRVVAALAPQAIQKGQQIEVEAQDGCLLDGDDTLLSVLVRNLVDNAIRYSPAGARIRLTLQKSADRIELGVEDSGPGMQAADIDHLGERFFRVIGSGQGGSGLGWSIVRRIAAAHRAELRIEPSGELGGLSIRVTWLAAS